MKQRRSLWAIIVGSIIYITANYFDGWTTYKALGEGATEKNPILGKNPNKAKFISLKVAGFAVTYVLVSLLHKEITGGLPGWAEVLVWTSGATVALWAAWNNLGVIQRLRRDNDNSN